MGRGAVGTACTAPCSASKRLPASSLPLPNSTIYSFQMPPLRNHTSYYSEDYFVGTLNTFVGSLAPSTPTAHSVTFTQGWKRLVILYYLALRYWLTTVSLCSTGPNWMSDTEKCQQKLQFTVRNQSPDTVQNQTHAGTLPLTQGSPRVSPLPFIFLSARAGKKKGLLQYFLSICKVLTSYNDGVSQKLRQTLGQTVSPASVARASQEQIPTEITQPTV